MRIVAIIPARMGSSRFPGKPLALIKGRPMVEHVYKRTAMSDLLDDVVVATCDTEIEEAVQAFGGKVIMTSKDHETAADRVAEAARHVDADIVIMVQGDEPLTHPAMIEEIVAPLLEDESIVCSNPMRRIETEEEYFDRNAIKVVLDRDNFALFMTREPIPTTQRMGFGDIPVWRQIVLVPFRRAFLFQFASWERTPLEIVESVDMLRILENGYKIKMVESAYWAHAVDTPRDLDLVERMMDTDSLAPLYL